MSSQLTAGGDYHEFVLDAIGWWISTKRNSPLNRFHEHNNRTLRGCGCGCPVSTFVQLLLLLLPRRRASQHQTSEDSRAQSIWVPPGDSRVPSRMCCRFVMQLHFYFAPQSENLNSRQSTHWMAGNRNAAATLLVELFLWTIESLVPRCDILLLLHFLFTAWVLLVGCCYESIIFLVTFLAKVHSVQEDTKYWKDKWTNLVRILL